MAEQLRQWTNDAGTMLVDSWADGAVQIKERPTPEATWGLPLTLRAGGGAVLNEIDRVIVHAGLTALLGMWASARETFGDQVPELEHADRIRDLIARLA